MPAFGFNLEPYGTDEVARAHQLIATLPPIGRQTDRNLDLTTDNFVRRLRQTTAHFASEASDYFPQFGSDKSIRSWFSLL